MANMKNLFLGLALLVLSEVHAQDILDVSCLEIFDIKNLNRTCCKHRNFWFDEIYEKPGEYEKCKNIKADTVEGFCAHSECIFQESGIMKDGKVQHEIIQEIENSNDSLATEVKRRCFGGKDQRITTYSNLSPTKNCPAFDLIFCVVLNVAVVTMHIN